MTIQVRFSKSPKVAADGRQRGRDDGLVQRREERRQHQSEEDLADLGVAHRAACGAGGGWRDRARRMRPRRPRTLNRTRARARAAAREKFMRQTILAQQSGAIVMLQSNIAPQTAGSQRPSMRTSYDLALGDLPRGPRSGRSSITSTATSPAARNTAPAANSQRNNCAKSAPAACAPPRSISRSGRGRRCRCRPARWCRTPRR